MTFTLILEIWPWISHPEFNTAHFIRIADYSDTLFWFMEIGGLRTSEKIARNQAVNEKNCPAVIGWIALTKL